MPLPAVVHDPLHPEVFLDIVCSHLATCKLMVAHKVEHKAEAFLLTCLAD